MRRRFYPRDPYWTTARFNSQCACGHQISKGDRIFYYPNQKKAVCEDPCGAQGAADLQAAVQDETVFAGAYADRVDGAW